MNYTLLTNVNKYYKVVLLTTVITMRSCSAISCHAINSLFHCFKYLGSQVAADGGCEGMWGIELVER